VRREHRPFLDPAIHGRGIGTEAVRRVVRQLIEERGQEVPDDWNARVDTFWRQVEARS